MTEVYVTEYRRTYTEKEVQEILVKDLASKVGVDEVTHSKLYVESRDGSTGPYKVYNLTVEVHHQEEDEL